MARRLDPDRDGFETDPYAPAPVGEAEQTLGRFRLLYQIAAGGMATVFLARSVGPGGFERPVAIKRIHPHLAHRREFVDMFLDEARIAARINHPNVCAIHDFGEADGMYYIAMEYLVGVSIGGIMKVVARDRALVESRRWRSMAAFIAREAAEGLHAAHELRADDGLLLDVVHRDVSPQNLFVTFDGAVKVVDFGVAQARDRLHHTTTGTIKGKLAYMAPEHAGGEDLDRRADVWSLGVVLWEMLTGRRLFRRKNEMDTLLSVATGPIPAPSSIAPNVPAALDAIVGRCLARDLGARYASARELGRDLTQFLQSEPEATSMADLSEWLAPLLVSERTERGELLKTAFEVGLHDAQTAALASEDPTEIESSGVRGTPRLLAAQTPIVRVEGARSSRRGLVIAGALVALLGAGAGVLWSSTMADPAVSPVSPTPIPASDPDASPTPSPSPSPNPDAIANPDRDPDAHRDPNPDTTPTPSPTPSPTPMGTTSTMTGRRTMSAEPAGEGALSVAGRCWAQVYAGTRLLGQSPAQFPLPAGRHRLRVVPRGAGTGYTVGVRISAGEVTRIAVRCE